MGLYDFFERKLTWHYLVGNGESFFRTLGTQADEAYTAVKDAVKQRFLTRCADEAIPYIAQTFNLDYPARYTATQARNYIGDPFLHWEDAGSRARLITEIKALGYVNVEIFTYRDLVDTYGADPVTTFGGYTSFFYVLIRPPFPFAWDVAGKWGPPPVGSGALWGSAPFLWGISGAAPWQFDELRRVIRKWTPAAARCCFIEVWLRVSIFGVPLEIRRFPVRWDWELDGNGAGRDFYNSRYDKETA